jgi:signal-transduction protein with cAMP-binding, CBS, and nucleotidyltransferase domain
MHRPLITLRSHHTVADALGLAREHSVHHFPVCDQDRAVGMVCTCDLQEAKPDQAVGDLMRPPVTLSLSRFAADAATLMKAADVGSVLIVDANDYPCGIVTRGDLNGEPPLAAILENCRCDACGSARHLQRYRERSLCFSCRERALEPQAFESGGGD